MNLNEAVSQTSQVKQSAKIRIVERSQGPSTSHKIQVTLNLDKLNKGPLLLDTSGRQTGPKTTCEGFSQRTSQPTFFSTEVYVEFRGQQNALSFLIIVSKPNFYRYSLISVK